MRQGTPEWLEWRKTGIGSSDAPIITGISPYKTRLQKWLEDTGRVERKDIGFAGFIGHRAEPFIRGCWEQKSGLLYEPVTLTGEIPWMLASLDGAEIDMESIIECKLNDWEKHQMALDGEVPDHHLTQIDHQLKASKATVCYYLSAPYRDDPQTLTPNDVVVIPVYPDEGRMEMLVKAEAEYIELLATDTAPEACERDFAEIATGEWRRAAGRWKTAKVQHDRAKKKLDAARDRLVSLAGDASVRGAGVKVTRTARKGNVAYAKVPELKGVDLDQYRGKPSLVWSVSNV